MIKGEAGAARACERLSCGLTLPNLEQDPAADQHGSTPGQEADVPQDPLLARHCLVNMVDAEQVMVDDPFDQVEQTSRSGACRRAAWVDHRSLRRDAHKNQQPVATKRYVVAWNRPSQKVLIFKFSTLVAG